MVGFLIVVIIGSSIGYFGGKIYHNRYGLSQLMNGLIGLIGACLAAFLAVWSIGDGAAPDAYLDWRVWLAAAFGSLGFIWLAGFLRGTQYD